MTVEKKAGDGQNASAALSSRRLVEYAVVLTAGLLLMYLVGYRRDPSLLVGSQVTGASALLGLVYMLLYAAFVLVVPVLLIATGLLKTAARFLSRRTNSDRAEDPGQEDHTQPEGHGPAGDEEHGPAPDRGQQRYGRTRP